MFICDKLEMIEGTEFVGKSKILSEHCSGVTEEINLKSVEKIGISSKNKKKKRTPWPLVASELYRLSDRHFLAKFSVPTLWIEGCCVVNAADPLRSLISVF
jgi:hypothetical protein